MRYFKIIRFSTLSTVMVAALLTIFATKVWADTPMCNEIVNDPTIATCTCICEAGSLFPGCLNQQTGAAAPTPNQCPDMLQGRRVIARGDALAVADPHVSGSDTVARALIYKSENDPSDSNLGIIDGTPASTVNNTVPCKASSGPFPQQTRVARLFDLPYDMVLTVRPTIDSSQIKSDCFATSSTTHNLAITVKSFNEGAPAVPALTFQVNPQWVYLAIDDFDYDGFDDILLINIDSIQLYTAVDTADPSKGLIHKAGVRTDQQTPINEPTTGDFNGDGLKEVAWIGGDFPNKKGTLSVFFATICPGDFTNTICDGATAFEVILDPAAKLFPGVTGATSTIVLDDAPLTPTACGVVQTSRVALFIEGQGPKPIEADVFRSGTVVLGNFENNGLNALGAPTDELVIAYVSGSAGSSSDPCSMDVQYWSFSTPPNSNPTAANKDSWAQQRGDTIKDLFPEVSQTFEFENIQGKFVFAPTINLYAQSSYLDWYGTVEQAVIGASGNSFSPGPPLQPVEPRSGWFPTIVSVKGTGENAEISACSAPGPDGDPASPFAWGSAVGRFSTSTTVNSKNPTACNDFDKAAPGDCPYNPQIAMLVAKDGQSPASVSTSVNLYTVQQSKPGTSSLECNNDKNVDGFLPKAFKTVDIGGFSPMPVVSLRAGSLLRAGDTFGNSVRVGNPTITRISQHTQPQMVIQTPPSLIDYVLPSAEDSNTPAIVNFTRAPDNFNTQILFKTESQDTSATSQTTSHSTSFTESISGEVKFGVPLISSIDVKNKESWSQFHESNTSSQFSNYVTTALETGGTIGVDDQLWWTQTTFNVFHFPVVGETICPASLTCDASDPANIVCDGGSMGDAVALTCAESGDGCHCLSEGAPASLCPAIPSDPNYRTCTAESSDVCCSQLQQQLYMSLSGPEEVTRKSQQGATSEFYHPKHEPGQILSYPSNLILLQTRLSNPQELATLDRFSTGTNSEFETITYTSGCEASEGTGTTTRHSFESDTSLTAGTPKLAEETEGATVTASFDYNVSTSTSTLNSYTVGQTSSSSVQLNLQGAGFLNPDQYAYDVEGIVYGQVKPEDVLDTPDLTVCPINDPSTDSALCKKADQEAAGCTTTGPLQVAYAADPTAGDGGWWQSAAPYLQDIDIALNNPSRWRSASVDQVANANLQCRGPQGGTLFCYASNQPPTKTDASSVWDADFFDMKGLLVTNGGTAGPQRDTATVGDEIFLQARVANYSLTGTADIRPGSTVYVRFYRQQLDVTAQSDDNFAIVSYAADADGKPLAAVPIGPRGLGDTDPIKVVSPQDESASIPGFNTTTDPANDNISIATTSYTASADDACEYVNGVQKCDGAYYAYWVTAWIEDSSGKVLSELPGHGLKTSGGGAFKGSAIYEFITDVPLETVSFDRTSTSFSNNVGMFKKVFSIIPAETSDTAADAVPADLTLDLVNVTPAKTVLGEPVVVSAQVASLGAATPGATVVFTAGEPENGGEVFDAEWLPHIRANDSHFVRVNYNPEACGTQAIVVNVTVPNGLLDEAIAMVDVGIDVNSAINFLIAEVRKLRLGFKRFLLISQLRLAKRTLDADLIIPGVHLLEKFNDEVAVLKRRGRILPDQADFLISQVNQIIGCIW